MHALTFSKFGTPDVLEYLEVPKPKISENEILVKMQAIGLNWQQEVMKITHNKGVDVVFDSIGSTLMDSFSVTKECGTVVFYGMSGGDPAHIDPRMLMDTSKTLTGGDLWSYINTNEQRISRSKQLFDWILKGDILIKKPVIFNLSDGQKAHEYLENGESSSKVLLIP